MIEEFLARYRGAQSCDHGFICPGQERVYVPIDQLSEFWRELLTRDFDSEALIYQTVNSELTSPFVFQFAFDWVGEAGYVGPRFRTILLNVLRQVFSNHGLAETYNDCYFLEYQEHNTLCLQPSLRTIVRVGCPNLTCEHTDQQVLLKEIILECEKSGLVQWLTKIPSGTSLWNVTSLLYEQTLRIMLKNTVYWLECYIPSLSADPVPPEQFFNSLDHQDVKNGLIDQGDLSSSDVRGLCLTREYGSDNLVKISPRLVIPSHPTDGPDGQLNYNPTPQEMARKFLGMLCPERFLNRFTFMQIGRALAGVFHGSDEGRHLWFKYALAARCNPDGPPIPHLQNLDSCYETYQKFQTTETGIDHRTLAWYAQIDSPASYASWHDQWLLSSIIKAMNSLTHMDLGEVFYRCCWLTVIACSSADKKNIEWYTYQRCVWEKSSNKLAVIEQFMARVVGILEQMEERVREQCMVDCETYHESLTSQSEDGRLSREEQRDFNEFKRGKDHHIEAFHDLLRSCKSSNFFGGMLRFAAARFNIDNFLRLADRNGNLTSYYNGVVESSFLRKEIVFRPGTPQDYLTRSTRIYFPVHYNDQTPEVITFDNWMKRIYPRRLLEDGSYSYALHHHVGKIFGSAFVAGNLFKHFFFFTGPANGGKSALDRCISEALGDLKNDVGFELLTAPPPDPTKPNPLLMSLSGPRFTFTQESNGSTLKPATICFLSGNDAITTRACFSNVMERLPSTTVFIAFTNSVPPAGGYGPEMIIRLKIVPHRVTHSHNAPTDPIEQEAQGIYPLDPEFGQNVHTLAQAWTYFAFKHFVAFATEGLTDPEEVVEATRVYWEMTDIYAEFIKTNIEEVVDETTGELDEDHAISTHEAYARFCDWYKKNNPASRDIPNKEGFDRYMNERLRQQVNRHWYGYAFSTQPAAKETLSHRNNNGSLNGWTIVEETA